MEDREIVIDVKDLFAEYVRKLWIIVICAVLFAVLLGGYKYYKDKKAVESSLKAEDFEWDEDSFTDTEMEAIESYVYLTEEYQNKCEYLENSVYINLNADKTYKTVLQYYISAASEEQTKNLAILYYNYANKGGLVADIYGEDSSIEKEYLQELLIGQGTNYDSRLFSAAMNIQVYGEDEAASTELADKVKKQMGIYSQTVSQEICQHDLVLVDESASTYVDKNLKDAQEDVQDQITLLKKNISEAKEKLSEEQLMAARIILGNEQPEEESKESVPVALSKKFILLGTAAGIFFAIALIYIMYYFNRTVKTAGEFTKHYGLNCFGVIETGNKTIWEKWADKLFYAHGKKGCNPELIVPKINAVCNNAGIKRVVFSVNQDTANKNMIDHYAELLKESGRDAEVLGDIMNDPAAIQRLEINQNVILVEEVRKTGYEDVRKEILFCKEQGIHVLGCIVFSK